MKLRIFHILVIAACLLMRTTPSAQDSAAVPKIELTGLAALEEGQFIKCNNNLGPMPFRPWLTNEIVRLGFTASINRHFSLTIIPQIRLWNDTWNWTVLNDATKAAHNPLIQHSTVSIYDAEGVFSFGNSDAVAFNLAVGAIPYKYDAMAKNLGEYLFRTGEHPAYIMTSFDEPYVTLTGLRARTRIFRNFSADLFFTTETQIQPLNDWSVSFLLDYTLPGYLNAGAGVMFDRLFSAVPLLDKPVNGTLNTYFSKTGELDTFSWGGTKVMARLTLDPKGFLPANIRKIFGKDDGKIYGEAAILGVQNITPYKEPLDENTGQPIVGVYVLDSAYNYYSNIKERIPVMFGFNVPVFKLLDYLSAEFEWYDWPYSPGMYTIEGFKYFLPLPNGIDPTARPWKFSFNARKTIWEKFSIIGQIARDHTRHDAFYLAVADPTEIFRTGEQWGWWTKLQYSF
jgi:hypothetical protein